MSAGESASIVSPVNGAGDRPLLPAHRPLSAKESGAYDHLEASETLRYVEVVKLLLCVCTVAAKICQL